MYIDAASSLVDYEQQQNPTHHFIPVTEHWLKRAINTWSVSLPPPLPLSLHPSLPHSLPHSSFPPCLTPCLSPSTPHTHIL